MTSLEEQLSNDIFVVSSGTVNLNSTKTKVVTVRRLDESVKARLIIVLEKKYSI